MAGPEVMEHDGTDYFGCLGCSHAWPQGEGQEAGEQECPECGSDNVVDLSDA